jgi:methylenetetrahydrofolate dehydrogenase (NADP+)/methenyltetrahydrofolate cyclohydrolase
MIHPIKDVDGLSPTNQALVYQGSPHGVPPCTASAVIAVLKHYNVPLAGARITIVGRSLVVGKPLAMLLLGENATVTICHSQTKFLMERTREADVVIAAIGRRKLLGLEYFSPGQTVVDVGIHEDDDGSLVGDVDLNAVEPILAAISPAKGGVGSVTTTVMLEHVVTTAERLSALHLIGGCHA